MGRSQLREGVGRFVVRLPSMWLDFNESGTPTSAPMAPSLRRDPSNPTTTPLFPMAAPAGPSSAPQPDGSVKSRGTSPSSVWTMLSTRSFRSARNCAELAVPELVQKVQ